MKDSCFCKETNRGFTLLELLVVIAILGLVSAVVLASLNSAREKSRDAQRSVELKELEKALYLYHLDNGAYPIDDTISSTWNNDPLGAALEQYLDPLPLGSSAVSYGYTSVTGGEYALLAIFEDPNHPFLGQNTTIYTCETPAQEINAAYYGNPPGLVIFGASCGQ